MVRLGDGSLRKPLAPRPLWPRPLASFLGRSRLRLRKPRPPGFAGLGLPPVSPGVSLVEAGSAYGNQGPAGPGMAGHRSDPSGYLQIPCLGNEVIIYC
jgi:hypothetical protein